MDTITSIANSEVLQNIVDNKLYTPQRIKMILGVYAKGNQYLTETTPSKDRSMFNQEKYKFFLDAPFEISNKCCSVMKKAPAHSYTRKNKRYPITAEMASESRLRTQKWIQNGCNGFNLKIPKSTPMAFWTEQDVLLYIYLNEIPIASPYGEIVRDFKAEGQLQGQMDFSEFGLFDTERPSLKTTGCNRTGCVYCGFGCHLEKQGDERFVRLKETHPQLYDYCMNKIQNSGYTLREVIDWINEHGNMNIKY